MKVIHNTYEPITNFLLTALHSTSILHDAQYAETMSEIDPENSFLYLPLDFFFNVLIQNKIYFLVFSLANEQHIAYYLKEYDPLLDSTNMTFDNYIRIALDIKVRQNNI